MEDVMKFLLNLSYLPWSVIEVGVVALLCPMKRTTKVMRDVHE